MGGNVTGVHWNVGCSTVTAAPGAGLISSGASGSVMVKSAHDSASWIPALETARAQIR